ncbi:actin-related protein 6-like [Saccostrea cucullata]|uniref:actin-related protein 6-like n=1 Tax=Saccostrea cuccullata TaxID=36930 RepID=UPI002ED3D50C
MMATVVLDNGAGTAKVGYATDKEPSCVAVGPALEEKEEHEAYEIGETFINKTFGYRGVIFGQNPATLHITEPPEQGLDSIKTGGFLGGRKKEKKHKYYHVLCDERDIRRNDVSVQRTYTASDVTNKMSKFLVHVRGVDLVPHEDILPYQSTENPIIDNKLFSKWQNNTAAFIEEISTLSFMRITSVFQETTENVRVTVMPFYLKKQLMVMDETYVINQVKEDVCYVSTQFMKDMETAKKRGKENTIARDYVLPDYTHIKRGYVRPQEETTGRAKDGEQIIRMNNERFAIPELLFHPSDVGVQEMGVAEALVYAISTLPEEMRPHMYSNIVLTGGNCLLPGFSERFYADVRSMAPEEYDISTKMPSNPVTYAWEGGRMLANTEEYKKMAITREQYEEHGHSICAETFDI